VRISKKGEYALRAMCDLALHAGEGCIRIEDISARQRIPEKFLEQILLQLRNAGLLESKRGVGGGYKLAKPPEEITLAGLLRIVDGRLAPVGCVSEWARIECPEEDTCGLKRVMLGVRNAIVDILEDATIADVCEPTRGKRKTASRTKKGCSSKRKQEI
jgi:Rrf2 family protein